MWSFPERCDPWRIAACPLASETTKMSATLTKERSPAVLREYNEQTYRLQLSENNTFIGTAGDHLYLIALIALIEEPNGSNGRAMIVQRLQKVVPLIDAEHVD